MSPTRRQVLLAGTGGVAALAGCSALAGQEQSLLVAVNNYTDSRRDGEVLIERGDTDVVRQYVEVAAATPDTWGTVETEVALGEMPDGTSLDVTVSFGDGLTATSSITLDCSDEYSGDALYVQIEAEVNLRLVEGGCYDEFPSEEAVQGGVNRS